MLPLVSIIIPVFNGSNYLHEAIDSALTQTYENIEIIVVNDGSDDFGATRDIALSYGDKIRYFEKDNEGVSSALNLGIREMRGEFFSWLSHDDIYLPDKIKIEMNAFKLADNDVVAVYSGWDSLVMPGREYVERGDLQRALPRRFQESGTLAVMFSWIHGCSLLIPKSLLVEAGGFDLKYKTVQDYKMWFDLFRGKRLIYIPQKLMYSRIHSEQGSRTNKYMYEEENWLWIWMINELNDRDVELSKVDLYSICSFMVHNWSQVRPITQYRALLKKMISLPEPSNLSKKVNELWGALQGAQNGVYVYCAGNRGQFLTAALQRLNFHVDGIGESDCSKWGQKYAGVEIIPCERINRKACVIVAKKNPWDLVEMLKQSNFENVTTINKIYKYLISTPIYKNNIVKIYKDVVQGSNDDEDSGTGG